MVQTTAGYGVRDDPSRSVSTLSCGMSTSRDPEGLDLEGFANSDHSYYSKDSLVFSGAVRVAPGNILQLFSRFYFFLPDTAVLLASAP